MVSFFVFFFLPFTLCFCLCVFYSTLRNVWFWDTWNHGPSFQEMTGRWLVEIGCSSSCHGLLWLGRGPIYFSYSWLHLPFLQYTTYVKCHKATPNKVLHYPYHINANKPFLYLSIKLLFDIFKLWKCVFWLHHFLLLFFFTLVLTLCFHLYDYISFLTPYGCFQAVICFWPYTWFVLV